MNVFMITGNKICRRNFIQRATDKKLKRVKIIVEIPPTVHRDDLNTSKEQRLRN